MLMELCQADLRCLDAHAHLGNFVFDHIPQEAIRHYEVGVRIGDLSLGNGFGEKMLWINPSDNQGVRFLVDAVRAGKAWEEKRDRR